MEMLYCKYTLSLHACICVGFVLVNDFTCIFNDFCEMFQFSFFV